MTLLDPHLTRPQGEAAAAREDATVPGMAHWGGTGPDGATCRMCKNWGHAKSQWRRDEIGELLPKRCAKFTRMMQGLAGPGVPFSAAACRFYEYREKSPPIESPRVKTEEPA